MAEVLIFATGSEQQRAILAIFNGHNLVKINDDYYEAKIALTKFPMYLSVGLAFAPLRIGRDLNVANALNKYQPKSVIFVGIAASVSNDVNVGDVVIGSHIIDITEIKNNGDEITLSPTIVSSPKLLEMAESMKWLDWSKSLRSHNNSDRMPKTIIGSIINSSKLVNQKDIEAIRLHNRKLSAIDMESAGLLTAAKKHSQHINYLTINGISSKIDKGDNNKANVQIACDVAATFLFELLRQAFIPSYAKNMGHIHKNNLSDKKEYSEIEDLNNNDTNKILRSIPDADIAQKQYKYHGTKHFQFFSEVDSQAKCLGIADYAKAVAHVLDHAKGEVCISIMGSWGRGKTFLTKSVESELQGSDINHKYGTVWFSAWKYRTFPEIWVHLYQTVAEASMTDGIFSSIPRTLRSNLVKLGVWPIFWGLISLNIIILPFIAKVFAALGAMSFLLSALGVLGVTKVIIASPGVTRTIKKLSKQYLRPTSHEEKLGLQASIGKDLKFLISGWLGEMNLNVWQHIGYYVIVLLTGLNIYFAFSGVQVQIAGFIPLRPSPTALNFIIMFWFFVAITSHVWTLRGGRNTKRLLLVVDDLDRCPSHQILDVIESIKLLLEDKDISNHVQVIMLVEDEVLKQAILQKYKFVSSEYTNERVIEDNIHKIFLATFSLPPLSTQEIAEISNAYIVNLNVKDAVGDESQGQTEKVEKTKKSSEPEGSISVGSLDDPNVGDRIKVGDSELLLTPSTNLDVIEQQALIEWINNKDLGGEKKRSITPRSIQSLLFRYQLARYILMLQRVSYDPYQLSRLLIDGADIENTDLKVLSAVSIVSI